MERGDRFHSSDLALIFDDGRPEVMCCEPLLPSYGSSRGLCLVYVVASTSHVWTGLHSCDSKDIRIAPMKPDHDVEAPPCFYWMRHTPTEHSDEILVI
jgi:hypothetical protein